MQQRHPGEIFDREVRIAREQRRAAHGDDLIVEQLANLEARLVDTAMPNSDIDRIRIGRSDIRMHVQREVDQRVRVVEIAKPRDQPKILSCDMWKRR